MRRVTFALFFLLIAPSTAFSLGSDLSLHVDSDGWVSIEIQLRRERGDAVDPDSVSLYAVVLPFRVAEGARLQFPEDAPTTFLKRGEGYTILTASLPRSRPDTIVRVPDAFSLEETSEGRAHLKMDLSYPLIPQADSILIQASFAIKPRAALITLPREYEEVDVTVSPASHFTRVSNRQYSLDVQPTFQRGGKASLVFPNPMASQLRYAKIILGAVLGVFTLLFHLPALKERRLSWSLAVLSISSAIFGLILYYSNSLSKSLELIEWAAGFAPHVLYGMLSSLYLVLVARKQAMVTGRVTLDGEPIQIADVQLWRVTNDDRKLDRSLQALAIEGRYSFRTRATKPGEQLEVTVRARGTSESNSGKFEVARGKQIENKTINLEWIPASS